MHENEGRLRSVKIYKGCRVIGHSQWNPLIRTTGALELGVGWGVLVKVQLQGHCLPANRSKKAWDQHFNKHQAILMKRVHRLYF